MTALLLLPPPDRPGTYAHSYYINNHHAHTDHTLTQLQKPSRTCPPYPVKPSYSPPQTHRRPNHQGRPTLAHQPLTQTHTHASPTGYTLTWFWAQMSALASSKALATSAVAARCSGLSPSCSEGHGEGEECGVRGEDEGEGLRGGRGVASKQARGVSGVETRRGGASGRGG